MGDSYSLRFYLRIKYFQSSVTKINDEYAFTKVNNKYALFYALKAVNVT